MGVRYRFNPVDEDLKIINPSHWITQGSGISQGETLRRLLGVEADEIGPNSPVVVKIAETPYFNSVIQQTSNAHMTVHQAGSALVFATGTMVWSWGLDDYNQEIMGKADTLLRPTQENLVSAKAQWMMRNVLARFAGVPETALRSQLETIWLQDGLTVGAVSVPGTISRIGLTSTNEPWSWVSNPRPYAWNLSARSSLLTGIHQLYFEGISQPVITGDRLIAYVYLDSVNPPSEIMLQRNAGSSDWEHRAYWGTNEIPWGTHGTASRFFIGDLPIKGQWVRLEVPASAVGLEGRSIAGVALTMKGGRANWDHVRKSRP